MNTQSGDALQHLVPVNNCFGCGPNNENGLRIKSYWKQPGMSVCSFAPAPYHTAGPEHVLNGGIIATVIDCHCVITAWADAYERLGEAKSAAVQLWYATGSMSLRYVAPAAIDAPAELAARIISTTDKKTEVACTLESNGNLCVEASIVAIRVSAEWQHGRQSP